jgi:hypothetical protein
MVPYIILAVVVAVFGYILISVALFHRKKRREERGDTEGFSELSANSVIDAMIPRRPVVAVPEPRESEIPTAETDISELGKIFTKADLEPLTQLLSVWNGRKGAVPYGGGNGYAIAIKECSRELAEAIALLEGILHE